jgi:glycosyltransferase involved in cell wall biosynthesis
MTTIDRLSTTHLVLIPSYNTGSRLLETVIDARRFWGTVWVVVDGSTDGSADALRLIAADDPALKIFVLPCNLGKGGAVLHGLHQARAHGFTHVLTMDADGQHNAAHIPRMMAISAHHPNDMVLGTPIFDATAPVLRVVGRKLANFLTNVATWQAGIGDALFGLRVYPILPLLQAFAATRWMRRFDFDPEAAIRLCRRGVQPINFPTPVKYFRRDQGGVSHFHYLRDNLLLAFMYTRLLAGMLPRRPMPVRPFHRLSK